MKPHQLYIRKRLPKIPAEVGMRQLYHDIDVAFKNWQQKQEQKRQMLTQRTHV